MELGTSSYMQLMIYRGLHLFHSIILLPQSNVSNFLAIMSDPLEKSGALSGYSNNSTEDGLDARRDYTPEEEKKAKRKYAREREARP